MKKMLSILLVLSFTFSLYGCKRVESIEYKETEVKIVNEHHNGNWIENVRHIGIPTTITHAEKYEIVVEYDGDYYTINGKSMYKKYNKLVGASVTGVFAIITYDDGTTETDIIRLK